MGQHLIRGRRQAGSEVPAGCPASCGREALASQGLMLKRPAGGRGLGDSANSWPWSSRHM